MKTLHKSNTVAELRNAIAAGSVDPKEKGPDVVLVALVKFGKTVIGSYSKDEPNIVSESGILPNVDELHSAVNNLVDFGVSFVTQTGIGNSICTLKWTIQD